MWQFSLTKTWNKKEWKVTFKAKKRIKTKNVNVSFYMIKTDEVTKTLILANLIVILMSKAKAKGRWYLDFLTSHTWKQIEFFKR